MQGRGLKPADGEAVAVVEKLVELAAVAAERGPFVEDFAEDVLHLDDVAADGQTAAEAFLQVGRGRQVVGVSVGLQQPVNLKVFGLHIGDQGVGRGGRGAARGGIIIQHAVDDGAGPGVRVAHDMADGEGGFVKEGFDDGAAADFCQGGLDQVRGVIAGGVDMGVGHGVSPH